MIYGLNFGAPDIPVTIRPPRPRRRVINGKPVPCARGTVAVLVGACQTAEEQHRMTITATNGRRGLIWEERNGYRFLYAYSPA